MSAGASKSKSIDSHMERASDALRDGDHYKCIELSTQALLRAHAGGEHTLMARILMPLEEARRQIRLQAIDTGRLIQVDNADQLEELPMESGCYLFEPILVGADGRAWRERAQIERVPVLVVVHEPLTTQGDWPLVMVGAVTIRARVAPPKKVTINWLVAANEALGEEAIEMIDTGRSSLEQLDNLYAALQTLPDHDRLHQILHKTCESHVQTHANAS